MISNSAIKIDLNADHSESTCRRLANCFCAPLALLLALFVGTPSFADVYRWDNGQLIPGTEGITPGPGVQLDQRELPFAALHLFNLAGATFDSSNLNSATLFGSNLSGANLRGANLTNVVASDAILESAVLDDAIVSGANLQGTVSNGFTKEQLYSTASYKAKNLQAILLGGNFEGWDFSQQDLTNAFLGYSTFTNVDLTGAIVSGTSFSDTTSRGFTKDQLYSTASYQSQNLARIELLGNDLSGWDFHDQRLDHALLRGSTLTDSSIGGALVTGTDFEDTTSRGFTKQQLYSTASYQAKDLSKIVLARNDLDGWDFTEQNLAEASFESATLASASLGGADLTNASFWSSKLTNANLQSSALQNADFSFADLSGANLQSSTLSGADFSFATVNGTNFSRANLTPGQLYSTASYKARDLLGVILDGYDLSGWDFHEQNLRNASFDGAKLSDAIWTGANLTGAIVARAYFVGVQDRGFTREHLYSTRSFQTGDLQGVQFPTEDLTDWSFGGQNLSDGNFSSSKLTHVNFMGATLNGTYLSDTTSRGFMKEQLYSTASYQNLDLRRISLDHNDLSGWDFSGQDLSGAFLDGSNFNNALFVKANLTGARLIVGSVLGADFSDAVVTGTILGSTNLTNEQLYSTWSYWSERNLEGIGLGGNDLTGWDLSGLNLKNAQFHFATLRNTDFSGSIVKGGIFFNTTTFGFTEAQLQSTASYQEGDLERINFGWDDISAWDLHDQFLAGARFERAALTRTNFTNANLAEAYFAEAVLIKTNFASIEASDADFSFTRSVEVNMNQANLRRATFAGASLVHAIFTNTDVADADFADADLWGADFRRANDLSLAGALSVANVIQPDGHLLGLSVPFGKTLLIQDYDGDLERSLEPLPLSIETSLAIPPGGELKLVFEADFWDSVIGFEPGIPLTFDGTLTLAFKDGVDLPSQIGRTIHVFDWTGVDAPGQLDVFGLGMAWGASKLTTTGDVTFLGLLAGNTNADDVIDLKDLNNVRNNFGRSGLGIIGDVNADGVVDLVDLNSVRNNFGTVVSQVVPEPSTFGLLVVGIALVLTFADRRE